MYYAVGRVDLHLPACHSLKEKRAVLNRLKARLANRSHASIAEVDHQDLHQRCALGLAFVVRGPNSGMNAFDAMRREIEEDPRVVVLDFVRHVGQLGSESDLSALAEDERKWDDEEGEEE